MIGDSNKQFKTLNDPYKGFHDMKFVDEFGPAAFINRARKEGARDFGACMSPHTAFLILARFRDAQFKNGKTCL